MLYCSNSPGGSGRALNLANAGELAPPDYQGMSADEYRGYLRAMWKRNPRPFLKLARDAAKESLLIVSADRYDLAGVLWDALVKVGAHLGLVLVDTPD